jgi:DNA-binding MarR family transcriptional regulator
MTTAATALDQVPMTTLLTGLGRDATARVRRAQQFMVLKQLQVVGQTSQAELADALGIDRSNLAVVVAELSDRGLVERTRDAVDRRRYVLRLARAGERLLGRADGAIAAAEEELLAPLGGAERGALYTLLRRLADGVDFCPTAADDGCAE